MSRRSSSARRVARSDLIASLAKARSVRLLAPLAAMANPTKRSRRRISSGLEAFRRLLLQNGGANIAGADRAFIAIRFDCSLQGNDAG